MKKIILLFLIPFTMIMADFTLSGQTLTPVNEDETTSATTYSTTGTAKTNWGFQPFTVPSKTVTVPAGGDIQAAINSLSNGGTIKLSAGTYVTPALTFIGKSNIVLEGAGVGKTILTPVAGDNKQVIFSHCSNLSSWDKNSACTENLIIRNIEFDGKDHGEGGITFAWGIANLLLDNIEVHSFTKSGVIINNNNFKYKGRRVTCSNSYIHDNGLHGLGVRFTTGVVVDNYRADNLKMGVDYSSVLYGEVSHTTVTNALWGGMKFPSNQHLYIHDTSIKDCHVSGIKLQEGTKYPPLAPQDIELENVTVENSGAGIVWIGTDNLKFDPPITSLVVNNVKLINNRDNWDNPTNKPVDPYGAVHTKIRANVKVKNLHEYGDSIGITDTHPINYYKHPTRTPDRDNVGWKSWPAIK